MQQANDDARCFIIQRCFTYHGSYTMASYAPTCFFSGSSFAIDAASLEPALSCTHAVHEVHNNACTYEYVTYSYAWSYNILKLQIGMRFAVPLKFALLPSSQGRLPLLALVLGQLPVLHLQPVRRLLELSLACDLTAGVIFSRLRLSMWASAGKLSDRTYALPKRSLRR